ncbi:uncharacterized protein LOC117541890 isoform X6 [Gymnodraco acuticeps]|uniref:Uncharacterized protein LOC117541890 isoform X6 n=1 Tax=Gymnodraco acuticeps TaxID=8218 RepID=A0A6P8UFP0_GYMAC|nr:uncharacterized protein LOC117541890 isoform X6 [Gymnodraco acuticeps]
MSQAEDTSTDQQERPVSPAPSDLSMKSDWSKEDPLHFRKREPGLLEPERPVSPAPSDLSMKSDWSKEDPLNFREREPGLLGQERPVSPAPSDLSMKSDWSKEDPLNFRKREPGLLEPERPVSPAPSDLSMKSDWSKEDPLNFREREPGLLGQERPVSPAPSDLSMKSDWSKEDPINFRKREPGLLEPERPVSPAPSDLSMKSDWSKEDPLNFREREPDLLEPERPVSPAPSDLSMKSDWSKEDPLNFRKREPGLLEPERPVSPAPSDLSMKSDWSKEDPLNFREREPGLLGQERPVSPAPSDLSMKSDWSKEDPINFRKREPGLLEPERPVSPAPSDLSMKSDWSKEDPLNFREREPESNILLGQERPVSPAPSDLSMKSDWSKEDPLNFRKREPGLLGQERPVSPASTNIVGDDPLDLMPKQSSASNTTSKDEQDRRKVKDKQHKLKEDLKKRIGKLHEKELKVTDTELYEIPAEKDKDPKAQTFDTLFQKSKKEKVRTVLMTGVAGIGKTFQKNVFMVDWAKERSNKNIDFIVSLNFSKLNSMSAQSLKQLIGNSLKVEKHGDYKFDECKLVFVLDGLEKCELPLDFAKNMDLKDIEEQASMDLLLTNLIKGNLLPSAHLWILSQPSGVDKIPPEYIQRVTECQENLKRRQKLASALRGRLLEEASPYEHVNPPNQKNTEHIIREVNGESVKRVKAVSDIFKEEDGKTIRTVLTTGESEIGKSLCVQKFIREWAKNDNGYFTWFKALWAKAQAKEVDVIFPLNILKLQTIRNNETSLMELLYDFVKETKENVISNIEQFKVLFVLDGFDAYQPPLDFDNNDKVTDVRERASVDVLLTNLIKGNLFPSARLWITSRLKLPDACVHRTTEIRCKPDAASHQTLKTQLKEQFTHVSEGIDKQKTSALLNAIYTDLYIIEGERGEIHSQHEVKQVQDAKFKPVTQETSIKYHDILKSAAGENRPIRTVLTLGLAGIGKTFATKKYMLDWAEGKANGEIFFIFPLSFRELNLRKKEEHTLEELIFQFCPGMKTSEIKDYDKYSILIVLDGLDECRLELDFKNAVFCTEVSKRTSVSVLLTNLIQGNLLSKAQIWITSRPAAANHIPADKVDRVTEVRGFNDEQKEEYFRKRFSDKDLAEKILLHVKKSRSLYIMCHIPVFCWITASVLEDVVRETEKEGERAKTNEDRMPKTLTDMYIYFLLLQCKQANVKYASDEAGDNSKTDSCWNARNKETIISLGKVAFEGLRERNLLFDEQKLKEDEVNIQETAVFSGLFTQIFKEGCGLYPQKMFCFVHLSIQEFLAALYVFQIFNNTGENLLSLPNPTDKDMPEGFYTTAIDKALDSENGDWDLFLRFLLGLSLETNQSLVQELLRKTEYNVQTNKETIGYIKEKIKDEKTHADKKCNLFYCLNELNDHSLVEEVKKYLCSESVTFEDFTTSQWSALTFVLLTSDERLDVFDLKKYLKSETVLLGMLPVVKVSQTALLSWCTLSEDSCRGLSSLVLSSPSNNLTELNLSHNDLHDSGVEMLAEGLKSMHCKLEILKLSGCQVTEKGCSFLASAIQSKKPSLKHLDLSYNHPGDNGRRLLSEIYEDPDSKLKTLCLDHCGAHRMKTGLKKYGADLKLDENTASKRLILSEENRKVKTVRMVKEKVERPEHKDRFMRSQVICGEGMQGLCYWEVEWEGRVGIAVTYEAVGRGWDRSGGLGCNEMSWSLLCSRTQYHSIHGKTWKLIEPNNEKTSKDITSKDGKTSKDRKTSKDGNTSKYGKTSTDFKFKDGKTTKDGNISKDGNTFKNIMSKNGKTSSDGKMSKDIASKDEKTSRDTESKDEKTSRDTEFKDEKTSKDTESKDEKTSRDTESKDEKTSKDTESKDEKTSKDTESKDEKTSKDTESKDGKTSRDRKTTKDGNTSKYGKNSKDFKFKDGKTTEDGKTSKDGNTFKNGKTSSDGKTSKAEKTSKDPESKDEKTSRDPEFKDGKTSKDLKFKGGKTTKDGKTSKDGNTSKYGKTSTDFKFKDGKTTKDGNISKDGNTFKNIKSNHGKTSSDGKMSKDIASKDEKTSRDTEFKDEKTSRDTESKDEKTSKDTESKDEKTSKDTEAKDGKTSKDTESKDGKTSRDRKTTKDGNTSKYGKNSKDFKFKDGKTTEDGKTSKDGNTFKNGKTSSDGKTSKAEKTSKDPESKDEKTSRDPEFKDGKTSKDLKFKGGKTTKDGKTSKDGKTFKNGKTSKDLESKDGKTSKDTEPKDGTMSKLPLYKRIAVFLDWEAGTLTYYGVTQEKLSLIHTFHARFTEPLFPCFWFQKGSVTLCKID